MPPGAETVWHWEFDPWVLALILLPGVLYVCGWRQVHRQMPHRFGAARLAAFLAGLAALFIAIASPLHAYADLLLTAHMLQHLLLMLIVPPLLLAGAPYQPLLRGDRKSTRLNSSHLGMSYAVFCLKKKNKTHMQ